MRCALFLLALLLLPAAADAQQPIRRVKLDTDGVQVGFQNFPGAIADGFKTGLWAPVVVRLVDDERGNIRLPVAVDGSVSGEVLVETADNDFVFSIYPRQFTLAANDPLQVVTYVKVSSSHYDLKITIKAGGRIFPSIIKYGQAIDVGHHLYLTLGDKLPDFHESLVRLTGNLANADKPNRPLHAVYENNPHNLPELWFGYNAVDLAILLTSNEKFVDSMVGDRPSSPSQQLKALAEWVRRGGRLVVSIAPANRGKVYDLLASPVWQPALPKVLSLDSKTIQLESLDDLRNWSNNGRGMLEPFQLKLNREGKPRERSGVRLVQHPTVSVWCKESIDGQDVAPLIVRFPHGMGNITLLAFDVNDAFLSDWPGRFDFWQAVVQKLAPAGTRGGDAQLAGNFGGFGPGMDISSRLYDELDQKFDTPTIPFGWVVLFIFIYIIVVGPVDCLVLKLLFKRLELTWVTFPAVVLTVSFLAYVTAYAIKGDDLKINKLDLIDIDMRSSLGDDFQPAGATAYGTSWFTILSPRIQNYTIGIDPVLRNWQAGAAALHPQPTMSWFGRPEFGGLGATGRGPSPGLFNRTYSYERNAVGLRGVPIPVWTTKSFTASWAAPFDKGSLPLDSKLTYEAGKLHALAGTLKSNLPFDLHEVGLVHRDKFYALADIPKGATVQLKLDPLSERALTSWVNAPEAGKGQRQQGDAVRFHAAGGLFDPTGVLRDLMFHEKASSNSKVRNHAHRALDWSWRLVPEGNDAQVQEVILVARVGGARGQLEQLQTKSDPRLPTHLWLGETPRPQMPGTLHQETVIRVLLPVAPMKAT